MSTWSKYAGSDGDWTETAYADPGAYLGRRARALLEVGPPLQPGATILDLACGDGGLAEFLPGYRYLGVDGSPEMVAAGRGHGREIVEADLNEYEPPTPVAATSIFRAVYYARDRRTLFTRIAGYTEVKLVFDLNPRQYRVEDVRADLAAAGFERFEARPFFVPQSVRLPAPAQRALTGAERVGPLARLLLRRRFTLVVAASR